MAQQKITPTQSKIGSGNPELDDILRGGFDGDRVYLIEGKPGSGKTTLALQFLLDGAKQGEQTLYVTLSETERELSLVAQRHGWSMDQITIHELIPAEAVLDPHVEQTILHPAEIELNETLKVVFDKVEELNPTRVVFDSLSELRLIAQSPLRYRRQILTIKHFFAKRHATVLLLDDLSSEPNDLQLHSIANGVLLLEHTPVDYGAVRRRLRIIKMRGVDFRSGFHDFTIKTGGLQIYPRLIAAEHHAAFTEEPVPSGNAELDVMLGGGLQRGTNALFLGAAGAGKSSLAVQYAVASAARGEKAIIFAFDEGRGTLLARARTLGLPIQKFIDDGTIILKQIDPAELSPGEFTSAVREAVERDQAKLVVIDSLNGYLNAMPDEKFLVLQMHELLSYLGQVGVLTILVLAQHGLVGTMQTPIDLSYLSDNVLMLRYFEAHGSVHRALSVVKKRSGYHENTIREFILSDKGITIGPPLTQFRGVFTGTPIYEGGNLPRASET